MSRFQTFGVEWHNSSLETVEMLSMLGTSTMHFEGLLYYWALHISEIHYENIGT